MSRQTHHVVPNGGNGWVVERGGAERATRVLPTKQEAIDYAREVSRNQQTELVIHGRDGVIQRSDSHGHDPCPPKDKA